LVLDVVKVKVVFDIWFVDFVLGVYGWFGSIGGVIEDG